MDNSALNDPAQLASGRAGAPGADRSLEPIKDERDTKGVSTSDTFRVSQMPINVNSATTIQLLEEIGSMPPNCKLRVENWANQSVLSAREKGNAPKFWRSAARVENRANTFAGCVQVVNNNPLLAGRGDAVLTAAGIKDRNIRGWDALPIGLAISEEHVAVAERAQQAREHGKLRQVCAAQRELVEFLADEPIAQGHLSRIENLGSGAERNAFEDRQERDCEYRQQKTALRLAMVDKNPEIKARAEAQIERRLDLPQSVAQQIVGYLHAPDKENLALYVATVPPANR